MLEKGNLKATDPIKTNFESTSGQKLNTIGKTTYTRKATLKATTIATKRNKREDKYCETYIRGDAC